MALHIVVEIGETALSYCYIPSRHEREDSVPRQIYMTFPSEISFTDADFSSFFFQVMLRDSKHHCFSVLCCVDNVGIFFECVASLEKLYIYICIEKLLRDQF